MNKKFVIISISIALLVVAIITGSSYAYFSSLNQTGSEEVITSGKMEVLFTDGAKIETNTMIPGDYIEKEFSVENTGNISTTYDIYLSEVINNFVDQTDLVYEIISLDGGYNTSNPVQVPNVSTKIVNQQSIGVGVTHHYKLKITFLSKNENQDDNQGKLFSAKIQVNEYQDVETTINYYLDDVLVSTLPTQVDSIYLNSTCDKGGTITFDTTNWTYTTNILQNGTTCNINFKEKKVTITYDAGDGSINPNTETISYGSTHTLPTPTPPTGYQFDGWYTEANGGGNEVTNSTTFTSNITLYAKYSVVYTVTYNSNGGSGSMSNSVSTSITIKNNEFTAPANKSFAGWNTKADGTGTSYSANQVVTANLNLYAQWKGALMLSGSSTSINVSNTSAGALKSYYGQSVAKSFFTSNEDSDWTWQLFYDDADYVFLIPSTYVKNTKFPSDLTTRSGANYYARFGSILLSSSPYSNGSKSTTITQNRLTSKYLKWVASYPNSTNNNIRAVAFMMDTSKWQNFAGNMYSGAQAIGGPTLELFIASWNAAPSHSSKQISTYNTITSSNANASGYITPNNSSSISSSTDMWFILETTKANSYFLASPCSSGTSNIFGNTFRGTIQNNTIEVDGWNFRPIVSIPKSQIK